MQTSDVSQQKTISVHYWVTRGVEPYLNFNASDFT
jgi:hypothetical protein